MVGLLISLIIPAYNVAGYIEKCLDSIKNQSYADFETIIVDDGSSDDTGAICDLVCKEDDRFRIIHQKNRGVSAARNAALQAARGDVIGFVDADDYLREDALEKVADCFSKNKIDAVLFGHVRIDENDTEIETRRGVVPIEDDGNAFLKYTLIPGKNSYLGVLWNKFFRTACLKEDNAFIQFSPKYKIGEDQIWLIKVAKQINKICCLSDALYYYRIRNNSAVHGKTLNESKLNEISARLEMVRLVSEHFPDLVMDSKIKYRRCVNSIALHAIKENDRKTFKNVKPYARKFFSDIIRSDMDIERKAKETLLQVIYYLYR